MRKRLSCFIVMIAALATLTSCSKKTTAYVVPDTTAKETKTEMASPAEIVIETETSAEAKEEIPEKRVEKDGKIQSYLTGEMVDVAQANRRPLAIMMSNDKESSPQYGINRAGVVYEAPVECNMNRYMSIIEDYDDLKRIGSVRSCRTYYIYFANEFDAIYAHFGQSTFAKPYLKYIDNINGIEGLGSTAYYRSKDKKSPHNAYASFDGIQNAIEKLGYDQNYASDYHGHFNFSTSEEPIVPDQGQVMDAKKVIPGYPYNDPWFIYHEDDHKYYRYQYGKEHMGDEGQIAVTNIILQYCAIAHYATTDYLNIDNNSQGWGFLITEGKAIPINWSKMSNDGQTKYTDVNGNEIILNRGKTWVCVLDAKTSDRVEILAEK